MDVCSMDGQPWAVSEVPVSLKTVGDPNTDQPDLTKINGQGTILETETGDPWHYSWRTLVTADHEVREFNLQPEGGNPAP